MDAWRIGFHRFHWIADDRQILIFDSDQSGSRGRFHFGPGNYSGNLVANKPDNICSGFGRAGSAEHWLVLPLQTILIDRHIPGGIYGDHAWGGFGLGSINRFDSRMRAIREKDLHVQHIFHGEVTGVEGLTPDFAACIHAGERFTDGRVRNHFLAFDLRCDLVLKV
jgi:hypothetical protein